MNTEINNTKPVVETPASAPVVAPTSAPVSAPASASAPIANKGGRSFSQNKRPGGSRGPGRGGDKERVKPEFDTKIINIRRVTRVASGGRRFSFSVAVVSGDHRGRVGVGLGKAGDTSLAIDKATRNAKKNMIKVTLSPAMTIPHMIKAKYSSAEVVMMPARGRGVVAGSAVRTVIELAGVKDICAKLLSGSKNKLNNARVAVLALSLLTKKSRASLNPATASIPATVALAK